MQREQQDDVDRVSVLQKLICFSEVYQESEQLVLPVETKETFREDVTLNSFYNLASLVWDNYNPSAPGQRQRQKAYLES